MGNNSGLTRQADIFSAKDIPSFTFSEIRISITKIQSKIITYIISYASGEIESKICLTVGS